MTIALANIALNSHLCRVFFLNTLILLFHVQVHHVGVAPRGTGLGGSAMPGPSGDKSAEEICRTRQISAATFYKWKDAEKTEADDNKRLIDQLEKENKRLKKRL
jgi:hypothetical protein